MGTSSTSLVSGGGAGAGAAFGGADKSANTLQGDAVFGYVVRRFVGACVLGSCATRVPAVFRALLSLVGELWKHYRAHLKGELAVFLRAVFLRTLRSCLLYTSPSPRDKRQSRMPSSA